MPTYKDNLCDPKYSIATLIGCILSFFQQMCGIGAVRFYTSYILTANESLNANQITALVGTVSFFAVIPTMWIYRRVGRKTMLTVMSFAIAGSLAGLGVSLMKEFTGSSVLQIVFLLMFMISFQWSLGPLVWIYMAEIMTEKGLSLGAGLNWISNVCIALFTKDIINELGGGNPGAGKLFLIFGGISAICGLFCLLVVKETKGLSEKEVSELYYNGSKESKDKVNYIEPVEDLSSH